MKTKTYYGWYLDGTPQEDPEFTGLTKEQVRDYLLTDENSWCDRNGEPQSYIGIWEEESDNKEQVPLTVFVSESDYYSNSKWDRVVKKSMTS